MADQPLPAHVHERVEKMPRPVLATLLRIARRLEEGFEGEVHIGVVHGSVRFVRWTQTETGAVLKEELG